METKTFSYSYTSPKLELRTCPEKGGYGLFAVAKISTGELMSMWGGRIVTGAQLEGVDAETRTHGIQVDEDLYLVPLVHGDPADYYNHSCSPNLGLNSPISLVAMRDIEPGEEVCFDYAMSDESDYDEFECHCGAPNCRQRVTGQDWKIPELHARYAGYFSPYIQRLINRLEKSNGKEETDLSETTIIAAPGK
jgi:uncharacterized protein